MTNSTAAPIESTSKSDSVFDCPRCNGRGYLTEFNHIKGGLCFLCAGAKVIAQNTAMNRRVELVCTVKKGKVTSFDANWKQYRHYNESIAVSFDGGRTCDCAHVITDANRIEMRALWVWCKNNRGEMILDESDSPIC